ncbi:MAG: GNAT family N-acetyltransferase [Ruminococcus sp.]|nr:GNAT family N-acetyltransferase [Ruminococcus sp.]
MNQRIRLEYLTPENIDRVKAIHREDISEDWVDDMDTIMEYTQYGLEHGCIGHTYAIVWEDQYIGVILLGEAIPWETDPPEMSEQPFYRLMNFIIDNRYRNLGIGGYVLETVIKAIYDEYGVRPIALGVHEDNEGAARFYERYGFRKTEYREDDDCYFIRYPDFIHPSQTPHKE